MTKAIMIVEEDKTTFVDMESGESTDSGDVCLVKIKDLPLLFTEHVVRAAFEAGKEGADYEQWLLEYSNGYHVMDA